MLIGGRRNFYKLASALKPKVTELNEFFSADTIPTTQSMNVFSVFCSCWMNENVFHIGTFKIDDELLSTMASKTRVIS